ncbi:hypothetical protein PCE1_000912 [Barthelona sp. PCE]
MKFLLLICLSLVVSAMAANASCYGPCTYTTKSGIQLYSSRCLKHCASGGDPKDYWAIEGKCKPYQVRDYCYSVCLAESNPVACTTRFARAVRQCTFLKKYSIDTYVDVQCVKSAVNKISIGFTYDF